LTRILWGNFSSFGEQLFGVAFDNNFGTRLGEQREQLWEAGTAWRNNFARQLPTENLKNYNFGE
jgi:hypothetical protein